MGKNLKILLFYVIFSAAEEGRGRKMLRQLPLMNKAKVSYKISGYSPFKN
jgi:hypothetical protein